MKILIVEDEWIVREDLLEIILNTGCEAETAGNSEEALQKVEYFQPQVIFCDINLGKGMNGIALISELKKYQPSIEVVYISALVNEDILAQASATVPFHYIVKPFNESQIRVTIELLRNYFKSRSGIKDKVSNLSSMEHKIVQLIAQQKNSKEIADSLFISEKTVRNHRYNITKKLNLPIENNSLLKWAITYFEVY